MGIDPAELLVDGPTDARATLILAHGAGAPMDSPFLTSIATDVAAAGVRVIRFEFSYMARRRREGGRKPPDRMPVLQATYRAVVDAVGAAPVWIGGKSMGGRVASHLADELGVAGLVCLGYPFHPRRRPDRLRVAHLADLATPALFVQGERDALGSRAEVEGYALAPSIRVVWIEDGDHSLVPRVRSGRTEAQNLRAAAAAVVDFVARV